MKLFEPLMSANKRVDCVLKSLIPGRYDLETLPCHPLAGIRTSAVVRILSVEERVQREIPSPRHPPSRLDQIFQRRFHYNCLRILLPWAAQVCRYLEPVLEQLHLRDDFAVVDHQSCGFARLLSSVCGHCVLLVVFWPSYYDQGVLDHGRGVAEDEVYGAGDDAVPVELAVGLDV